MVGDTGRLGYPSMKVAWKLAAGLARARPWLTISWIAHPEEEHHLVLHDGVFAAAMHFDDDAGPTFAGKAGVRSLEWEETSPLTDLVDWVAEWGPADPQSERTPKTAVYELLSALVDLGPLWSVQPARLLGKDGDPWSAYALRELFPSTASAVDGYLEMLEGQFREGEIGGHPEYWHEPLWLVSRAGAPAVVVDESGQLHLPHPASTEEIVFDVQGTLLNRGWTIEELAAAVSQGSGISITPTQGEASDFAASASVPTTRKLRICIDIDSILTREDWAAVQHARESGLNPEEAGILQTLDQAFAGAFGQGWWTKGLPDAIGGRIEWTLHVGNNEVDRLADPLYLAAADSFVGYFFTGCRLLISRLGVDDCDIYITNSVRGRVITAPELIRVGSTEFPDWHSVAQHVSRRARH